MAMTKKVRVVLAGCGGMSAAWLNAAKEILDVEIVGLVDIREEAAKERAEEYRLTKAATGTDLKTVLEKVRPDAVFDCTIPEAHTQVTVTAVRHGCHVMGEKPLADSMANARKSIAAAKKAGKIYAVIQNRRYDPRARRMRKFIASGALGQITNLNSDFFLGAHFGGFRDRMQHPLLLDMAIHTFDWARFISAADPVAVYCKEWNPRGSWYDHKASAVAIFEMTNGIVYTYRGSWCSEGLHTSWEAEWRIIGEKGTLKWDGLERFEAQVVEASGEFRSKFRDVQLPPWTSTEKTGGHTGLMREFVQCIQKKTVPETVCTDNVKSLAMVFGAIESAELGKRVKIRC